MTLPLRLCGGYHSAISCNACYLTIENNALRDRIATLERQLETGLPGPAGESRSTSTTTREAAVQAAREALYADGPFEDYAKRIDEFEAAVRAAERDAHAEVVRALVEEARFTLDTWRVGTSTNWQPPQWYRDLDAALAPFMTTEEAT